MSSDDRIFADDWRDCLREQYKYVIRQQDKRTEETLTSVLHDVGFDDDELRALKLEATMRAEDMPDDYVPDEVKSVHAGAEPVIEEAPVEELVIEAEIDEAEEEPEPVTYDELVEQEAEPETEDALDDEQAPEDDEDADAPQQMSLF